MILIVFVLHKLCRMARSVGGYECQYVGHLQRQHGQLYRFVKQRQSDSNKHAGVALIAFSVSAAAAAATAG